MDNPYIETLEKVMCEALSAVCREEYDLFEILDKQVDKMICFCQEDQKNHTLKKMECHFSDVHMQLLFR